MTEDAEAIASKLTRDVPKLSGHQRFRVEVKPGRSHTIVKIWYGQQHVGQYGIQRSPRSKRHNYLAEQLHLSLNDAYRLAKRPLDVDGYITILEEKGEV